MSTKLTKKHIDLLERFCFNYGYSLRTSYSGRGMYGAECIGFVIPRNEELNFEFNLLEYLEEEEEDELYDLFREADIAIDELGLSYIIYFPEISIEKESLWFI